MSHERPLSRSPSPPPVPSAPPPSASAGEARRNKALWSWLVAGVTQELPIKQDHGEAWSKACWHTIHQREGEQTEAMNVDGGVMLRTIVSETAYLGRDEIPTTSTGVGLEFLEGRSLVQRWRAEVIVRDEEDDHIRLDREIKILLGHPGSRWHLADATMPRPTDEQIRFIVAGKPAPDDLDSLRRENSECRRDRDRLTGAIERAIEVSEKGTQGDAIMAMLAELNGALES